MKNASPRSFFILLFTGSSVGAVARENFSHRCRAREGPAMNYAQINLDFYKSVIMVRTRFKSLKYSVGCVILYILQFASHPTERKELYE